ncbi:Uncharacterized membrane protein YkvA, DUF1232 family [Thermosyntropha lipolytica DSM 11003]|uniref:Uncharacterized membrane protein YkvA, DUF1232 family n=1 Tax=Thermosyntropha lipolytica DSM 11003 TaxID=1123382 RepID=A0A1M5MP87_9FIRM|nr:DUF1232 domain-containing protein [Thermosyntropha lipolytica]SHG78719.1 Uncharacterized membrane protein YkvA, DUF1232 family [Thermosyntropha lipolytica DSM 11003]
MDFKADDKKKYDDEDWLKEALLFIPNFMKLMYRLMKDERVPKGDKILLGATVAYVLSPFDFLPDVIPFLGKLDDLLLLALTTKRLMDSVDREVLLSYWDGDQNLLETTEKIINLAIGFIPPGIYRKLIKKAEYTKEGKREEYIDVEYEIK